MLIIGDRSGFRRISSRLGSDSRWTRPWGDWTEPWAGQFLRLHLLFVYNWKTNQQWRAKQTLLLFGYTHHMKRQAILDVASTA